MPAPGAATEVIVPAGSDSVRASFPEMRNRLAVVVALASACAFAACHITAKAGVGVPFVGGSELDVEVNYPPTTGTIPAQPDLPAGTCIEVTFYDAAGNVLGKATTTVGTGSFDIPGGTTKGSTAPCPPPEEKKDKSSQQTGESLVTGPLVGVSMRITPLGASNGGVFGAFRANGQTDSHARILARQFVRGMLSEPPPAGIDVGAISGFEVGGDSVAITMYTLGAPQSLSFDWNGGLVHFELSDASVAFSAGWYRTTVFVPMWAVNQNAFGTSSNDYGYMLQTSIGPNGNDVVIQVDA
jgi:hypothetical protein